MCDVRRVSRSSPTDNMVQPALIVMLLAVVAAVKNGRPGSGKAIPGEPGRDYPTLATVPRTSFSCHDRSEGFYADSETRCQVFHICSRQKGTTSQQSFLCPNGTIFNQRVNTCDWWNKVVCETVDNVRQQLGEFQREELYEPNEDLRLDSNNRLQQIEHTNRIKHVRVSTVDDRFVHSNKNQINSNRFKSSQLSSEKTTDSNVRHISLNDFTSDPKTSIKLLNTASQRIQSISGTTPYLSLPNDNFPVTEVSIKPRVRYTHNLKYTRDPIHSLNPIVQVARDASLLSTFTTSSKTHDAKNSGWNEKEFVSVKGKQPVQRYAIEDVLPIYNSDSFKTTSISPRLKSTDDKSFPSDEDYSQFNTNGVINNNRAEDMSVALSIDSNANGDVVQNTTDTIDRNNFNSVTVQNEDESSQTSSLDYTNIGSNDNFSPFDNSKQFDFNNSQVLSTVGSTISTPLNSNNENLYEDNDSHLVRVSSGYSFTSPTHKNVFKFPNSFRVTNSYSVADQVVTENPIRDTEIYQDPEKLYEGQPFPIDSKELLGSQNSNPALSGQNTSTSELFENNFSNLNRQEPTNDEFQPDSLYKFINRFVVGDSYLPPSTVSITMPNESELPHSSQLPTTEMYATRMNQISEFSSVVQKGNELYPPISQLNLPNSNEFYTKNMLNDNIDERITTAKVSGHYITKPPLQIGNLGFKPNGANEKNNLYVEQNFNTRMDIKPPSSPTFVITTESATRASFTPRIPYENALSNLKYFNDNLKQPSPALNSNQNNRLSPNQDIVSLRQPNMSQETDFIQSKIYNSNTYMTTENPWSLDYSKLVSSFPQNFATSSGYSIPQTFDTGIQNTPSLNTATSVRLNSHEILATTSRNLLENTRTPLDQSSALNVTRSFEFSSPQTTNMSLKNKISNNPSTSLPLFLPSQYTVESPKYFIPSSQKENHDFESYNTEEPRKDFSSAQMLDLDNSHIALPAFPPQSIFYSSYPRLSIKTTNEPTSNTAYPDSSLYSRKITETIMSNENSSYLKSSGGVVGSLDNKSVTPQRFTNSKNLGPSETVFTPKSKGTTIRNGDEVENLFPSDLGEINITPSIEAYSTSTTNKPLDISTISYESSFFSSSYPDNHQPTTTSPSTDERGLKTLTEKYNSFNSITNRNNDSKNRAIEVDGSSFRSSQPPETGFFTPKPFTVFDTKEQYLAPHLHSTILPNYKLMGKQLLKPADLFNINNLHLSTEPTFRGGVDSPDIVKSIGFSFDIAEEREQFEQARSRGWFRSR